MGITVGVLALNKKAKSRAFLNLASEMALIGYPFHIFGDDVIFGKDITEWPVFPALICFASDGFPLAKAQSYIELRKPFLINDPEVEADLGVRWKVYQRLKAAGVPCPEYLLPNSPNDVIVHKNGIVIDGKNLNRPFVEKPVNANNHDVWIYFDDPERSVRKLFRKTDSHASDIVTNDRTTAVLDIRRDDLYLYEPFLGPSSQEDIKVYAVGPNYAYAESRKSPWVDGIVERDSKGKEVRYVVSLTEEEKGFGSRITKEFRAFVCGFDILRFEEGKSFVCDVNGWSLVKGSEEYPKECAAQLAILLQQISI